MTTPFHDIADDIEGLRDDSRVPESVLAHRDEIARALRSHGYLMRQITGLIAERNALTAEVAMLRERVSREVDL